MSEPGQPWRPEKRPFFGLGKVGAIVAIVLVGGFLVFVAAKTSDSSKQPAAAPGPAAAPAPTVDERADDSSLARDHFRNVMGDGSKGILTDEELRGKLQEVNDNAIIGTAEVQAAATNVAAATTGTEPEFAAAIYQMDAANDAAGHTNTPPCEERAELDDERKTGHDGRAARAVGTRGTMITWIDQHSFVTEQGMTFLTMGDEGHEGDYHERFANALFTATGVLEVDPRPVRAAQDPSGHGPVRRAHRTGRPEADR